MIGRLKRSLKERCPECGKVLQLRVIEEETIQKGIIITSETEYICCSNTSCGYERNVEKKRQKKAEFQG